VSARVGKSLCEMCIVWSSPIRSPALFATTFHLNGKITLSLLENNVDQSFYDVPTTFSSFSSRKSFIGTLRQVVCKIFCLSASFIVPPTRSLVETQIIWQKSFIQAVKLNTLSFKTGIFFKAFVYIFSGS